MKVLFAIRDDSDIVDSLVRKYNKDNNKNMLYKEAKNFTAITKEVQENNDYDRIVISDNFDEKVNNSNDKEAILLKKLKGLLSVAKRKNGKSIPIIVICKNSKVAANMMELKINNIILKKDATKKSIYDLMVSPRNSSQAKEYYQSISGNSTVNNAPKKEEKKVEKKIEKKTEKKEINKVSEKRPMDEKLKKCLRYLNRDGMADQNYVSKFEAACEFFGKQEIKELIDNLEPRAKKVLSANSSKYNKYIPKEERVAVKTKKENQEKKENKTANKKTESQKNENKKVEEQPATEPKRGRGRPRKNPVEAVATVAAAAATAGVVAEATKRGRGRPRKNPVEIVEEVKVTEPVKEVVNESKNKVKEAAKKVEPIKNKVEKKIKNNKKKNEDWDLDEEDDVKTVANDDDDFEFDFEDNKEEATKNSALEVKDDEIDDILDFEEDESTDNPDEEFDFDEDEIEESDDDFDFEDEDETEESNDDFDFEDEDETEESNDDFDFEDEDETEESDDDFDFVDEDETEESDDDFDFEDEDETEESDDDFDFEDEDEAEESDDDFDFEDEDETEESDDDFDFEDEDETEEADDDFDFEDEDETEESDDDFEDESDEESNADESTVDDELDDFDIDDEDLENLDDDEIDALIAEDDDDEDEADLNLIEDDEEDEVEDQDDFINFDNDEEDDDDILGVNANDETSKGIEGLDDDNFVNLDDDEDSTDDDEFVFDDDDDSDDIMNFDEDEDEDDSNDDIINLDEEEESDDDILNLDDKEETDDDILNLDDEEETDDDILNLDDEEETDDDILNLDDEEETDDDILNLDDEEESDEDSFNLDDEEDEDILNLDEDENSDEDVLNLDDETSEDESNDDIMNLDDESDEKSSDSDDDFLFDLNDEDDESDDIKIDDSAISNVSGAAFSGIANKNYNPNYDISKQLNEINGDDSNSFDDKTNQNDKMVAVANMDMINIGDNQKVVAFVGAHNSGTSFIVNNLAQMLSEQGVKTAVVDLTKNKNSYYIYTENEENLRNIAYSSFEKLKSGIADGIKVNKCLTVYTALPNSDADIEDKANSMTTLLNNYSLVLLDCDFDTSLEYFNMAQDICFVQSFDILTIQALTSFIKKLKMNKVDYENKMKVIINKFVNLGSINERSIVAAMSVYNSPDTTYQLDLFDRSSVEYFVVPFEEKNYCKYLEEVVKCKLTIRGYTKNLLNSLSKLAKSVYPIGKKGKNK